MRNEGHLSTRPRGTSTTSPNFRIIGSADQGSLIASRLSLIRRHLVGHLDQRSAYTIPSRNSATTAGRVRRVNSRKERATWPYSEKSLAAPPVLQLADLLAPLLDWRSGTLWTSADRLRLSRPRPEIALVHGAVRKLMSKRRSLWRSLRLQRSSARPMAG